MTAARRATWGLVKSPRGLRLVARGSRCGAGQRGGDSAAHAAVVDGAGGAGEDSMTGQAVADVLMITLRLLQTLPPTVRRLGALATRRDRPGVRREARADRPIEHPQC